MSERLEDLAVSLFGELLTTDQLARNRISKALPKGMELSHFSVLNHLAGVQDERTPAQLAKAFHHRIFSELLRKSGSEKEVGHIRKLHIHEPLDGVCEAIVTVRFGDRLRALTFRFEGVDGRWLCTALALL